MLKNKLLILSLLTLAMALPAYADELSDLSYPKAPAYRVGISSIPEKQYIEALHQKTKPEVKAALDASQETNSADLTYADLSIKRLSKEIAQELEYEEQDMVADLSLLWQGAAVQSDTINFALYKLANPDADKPDKNSLKKVLTTIASMSTLVGASMSSPVLAGSSLIGGNIIGIMSQDTKALNYKYTKVGDADMIILIRKVEDLQQKAVNLYYDYMNSKQQLEFANKLVEERAEKFKLAQQNNAPRELVVITDAYYRTALDKQRNAKSEFFSKRAALEQFVGNETFVQFEHELTARENGEKTTAQPQKNNEEVQSEYNETIQRVEDYTNSSEPAIDPKQQVIDDTAVEDDTLQTEAENKGYVATLPELRPENAKAVSDAREVLTGSSSNVENSKKTKRAIFKKSKKEDISISDDASIASEKKSKKEKKEKKSVEKNSTKNLIFLHNTDKASARQKQSETTSQPSYEAPQSKPLNRYQQQNNEFNLMPLDSIKVPDLTPGGYSIHSGY